MAVANIVQTNFTAGEISPRMLGRVDIERYKNGAQSIENCLPLIHGGCKSTPSLRYVYHTKYSDKPARLIRFEFSKTEANIIEMGDGYMRFYTADGLPIISGAFPYEIATVYSYLEVPEISYVGGGDTIFFFHELYHPQRLRRFAEDNWVIDNAPFSPYPFSEQGHKLSATLTLSSASVGSGRSVTASSSVFLNADVGRRITFNGGIALITGYSSATSVTATIETAFESTSVASGSWTLQGTPQAVCNPSKNGTVGESITLKLASGTVLGTAYSLTSASYDSGASPPELDFSASTSAGIGTGDIVLVDGCEPVEYNGTYKTVSSGVGAFSVNYSPDPGAISVKGTVQKVTTGTSKNGFRSSDVGSFISINGGLIEITAFTSYSQVTGTIRQKMTSEVGAQANAWVLLQSMWSASNGYPRTGAFYQQRLICAGSTAFPNTVWASVIGEYLNFEIGTEDDAAFIYDIDATEFDAILHLAKMKTQLIALTSGKEFTLTGGSDSPITPTNVQVENPTDYGANDVMPVRAGNELLYINRLGKKLRAMGYRFENDSFSSPDLTKLSEHITGEGIVAMAYQQEPDSVLWMVRSDGVMVTCSIDREEGVIGFARQITNGQFESVCVIPNESGVDEVWCIVRRVINGSEVRYVERFDASVPYALDSMRGGVSYTAGSDILVPHLDAEVVDVVADGAYLGELTVTGGKIVIDRDCSEYFYGLPRRGYIKTLNPEIVTQSGSAQGNKSRIGHVTLRVIDTVSLTVGGQYIDTRKLGDALLDIPAPTYTGDVDVTKLGWAKNGFIEIEQPTPLPFHLLAIIIKLTVNN